MTVLDSFLSLPFVVQLLGLVAVACLVVAVVWAWVADRQYRKAVQAGRRGLKP